MAIVIAVTNCVSLSPRTSSSKVSRLLFDSRNSRTGLNRPRPSSITDATSVSAALIQKAKITFNVSQLDDTSSGTALRTPIPAMSGSAAVSSQLNGHPVQFGGFEQLMVD